MDRFGVTEQNWRDAVAADPHFAVSESPVLVARCAVALATDPDLLNRTGASLASWELAKEYGLTDIDGSRPDWGSYFQQLTKGRLPDPGQFR